MNTYTQYKVQSGDTLGKIARKFKTTVAVLTRTNNIVNPNMIRVGTVLSIPVNDKTPVIDTTPEDTIALEEIVITGNPVAGAAKTGGWFQPPKLYYLLGALAAVFILSEPLMYEKGKRK